MKEMMVRLPMVEFSASDELWLAKFWHENGRYIVRRDNGDISIADVILTPKGVGEVRSDDERLIRLIEVPLDNAELFDPDQWVLATDLENAKNAMDSDRERYDAQLAELNTQLANMKEQYDAELAKKEKEYKSLIDEKEAEFHERYAILNDNKEKALNMRRMELEHEYELKKMQLELETPKRCAQGEWISGKTLTEIIKTLSGGNKEE